MSISVGQKSLYDLLSNMRGERDLKSVFLRELNYDPVSPDKGALPTRGWPDALQALLANPPTLVAQGGAGRFHQLYLLNGAGDIVSKDLPRVLGTIKSKPEERVAPLPEGYNQMVMQVKQAFDTEVKHRKAERAHTLAISRGQAYALRELRTMFPLVEDEDVRARISLLERAFRGSVTAAITKDLNKVRANHLTGDALIKVLGDIYYQHRMGEWVDQMAAHSDGLDEPRIVCSEYLY
jgi:hypothetical protein